MSENYQIKPNEQGLYHVKFTRIVKEGKRTRDTYVYQTFTGKELKALRANVDKLGLSGATQFDEMEVIHEPEVIKPVEKAKRVVGKPAVKGTSTQNED